MSESIFERRGVLNKIIRSCSLIIVVEVLDETRMVDGLLTRVVRDRVFEDELLIDPNALKDDDGRNTTLARRTEGQKSAYVIHINSGMIMGIALRCYDNGKLVYAGFKNFAAAVSSGNNFLSYRELPGILEGVPENAMEVMEVQSEETLNDYRGCTDIEKENIRIRVCQAQGVYYNLLIYINNNYRITLYKACNTCPRFKFDTALSHAQQLVNSLQGWN